MSFILYTFHFPTDILTISASYEWRITSHGKCQRRVCKTSPHFAYFSGLLTFKVKFRKADQQKSSTRNLILTWECHKCKTLLVANARSVRCKMIQSLHTARLNERRLISKIRLVHSAVCLSRLHPSKLIVKCYSWCSTRWCSKGRFRRHGEDDRSMQRGLDRLGPWCFP